MWLVNKGININHRFQIDLPEHQGIPQWVFSNSLWSVYFPLQDPETESSHAYDNCWDVVQLLSTKKPFSGFEVYFILHISLGSVSNLRSFWWSKVSSRIFIFMAIFIHNTDIFNRGVSFFIPLSFLTLSWIWSSISPVAVRRDYYSDLFL